MALFDLFKKKTPEPQAPQPELPPEPQAAPEPIPQPDPVPAPQPDPAEPGAPDDAAPAEGLEPEEATLDPERIRALQDALNRTYPGLSILVRDVDLPEHISARYKVGRIFREKAYVEASSRVMGMTTSHRYAILSNHMTEPPATPGPRLGLRFANKDSHFKVLGKHTYQGKTCIFLLHLPDDESWKLFEDTVIDSDADLIRKCIARFEAKCLKAPVAELNTRDWLDRCRFPIGMDNDGTPFELE